MIVCKDCGHQNTNSVTFCTSCGTFLEWAGESVPTGVHAAIPDPNAPPETPLSRIEPTVEPPDEPAPAPEPGAPSAASAPAFQAQRLPVISDPAGETPIGPAPPSSAAPAEAAPDEPKAPPPARPGTQVLRAMRMKARPAPPPVAPSGPAARPPAEEHERRPPRPPSAEPARPQTNPGDIFCSSCGTPNDPSRHYCRSCGSQLAAGSVAPTRRLPWWRRLFRRTPKAAVVLPAGARPSGTGSRRRGSTVGGGAVNSVAHVARRFFQVIAVLAALGIAVVAIGPWRSHAKSTVRGWIDDARRVVQPHYVAITPDRISASTSLKAAPAANAFDGVTETFWAEAAHGQGAGQKLTVRFAKPVDIARIGVLDGDQSKPQAFATRPVPSALSLVFYDANGAVVGRKRVSLEQTPKFQRKSAGANGVSRLVITILSTYPAEKGDRTSASIAEIELFRKD